MVIELSCVGLDMWVFRTGNDACRMSPLSPHAARLTLSITKQEIRNSIRDDLLMDTVHLSLDMIGFLSQQDSFGRGFCKGLDVFRDDAGSWPNKHVKQDQNVYTMQWLSYASSRTAYQTLSNF